MELNPKNSNEQTKEAMMMNVIGLSLSLVLTSLAAASTIVKEGHRVVVVEYDQGGHQNTKISISPEQPTHANPKDPICDAYGKCKHKIVDAMEKSQEVIHEKKDEIAANKEAARQVAGKTKERVYDKARHVHEYAQNTVETAKNHIACNVSNAKDAFKRLIAGSLERQSLNSLMGVANMLGFSTAYGMCVWVTFISSYVQSRAMARQQFAVVQSKIYPVYFRAMSYSIGVALFAHVLAHRNTLLSNKSDLLQAYNLLASLVTLFFNSLYLEPRATKLMFERIKIEKEEGRGKSEDVSSRTKEPASTTADQDAVRTRIIKLNDKLKKLNSYSSFLNILNLMSLTWHLVYLAQRLPHIC
ncbi:Transmembrane protein 205 [Glycine max]|nr:Transmembrane protein 205 [Glycine max]